jgi:Uma2 family endonuclease
MRGKILVTSKSSKSTKYTPKFTAYAKGVYDGKMYHTRNNPYEVSSSDHNEYEIGYTRGIEEYFYDRS